MTNERYEILQSAEIKHLMHTFFTLAAPLFACRPSAARDELSQRMLELVLSVCHGQQHAETCRRIMDETDLMRSATDRILLRLEDLPISREEIADFLKDKVTRRVQNFDLSFSGLCRSCHELRKLQNV